MDEAVQYLRICTARLLKYSSFACNPELELFTDFRDSRSASSAEDVVHEIVIFILDTCLTDIKSRPDEMNLLVQGKYQEFVGRAVWRFFNEVRDRARGRDRDPVKYLYRRYRQVLSESGDFETGRIPAGGMWFAVRGDIQGDPEMNGSDEVVNDLQQAPAVYQEWDFPEDIFKLGCSVERQLFMKKNLLKIAGFFWKLAQENGMARRLPIRELVNYTAVRFPWLNRPKIVSCTEQGRDDPEDRQAYGSVCSTSYEDPDELAELAMSMDSITVLANDFVSRCSPEECRVFVMKMQELKLREIAARMNLKDVNRANTLYRSFSRKLKIYLASLPGPGFDVLPDRARILFMEELKRCCKNRE